jgi:hypothetical protein
MSKRVLQSVSKASTALLFPACYGTVCTLHDTYISNKLHHLCVSCLKVIQELLTAAVHSHSSAT